jgi:uncharacterized membrane protein (UPF0127 family)
VVDIEQDQRNTFAMRRRLILALPFLLLPLSASGQEGSEPTEAQPALPTEKLYIETRDGVRHEFTVEIATTPRQQQVGEMFRKEVPSNGGMLFVWPVSHPSPMWMKNTLVPLDMVFINPDGGIRTIAENTVPESLAPIDSGGPVKAVLELAGGTTARLGIRVGDKVIAPQFGSGNG